MEAKCLYDFEADGDDELGFKKGQIIKILSKGEDPHWYKGEREGREGLVPQNYIELYDHSWFHGKITRAKAESILMAQKFDGAYLIRISESSPNDFSLSVKYGDTVQHFKVLRDGAGKYFLWLVKFSSINEMLKYHKTSSVSRGQKIFLKDPPSVVAKFDFEAQEEGELPLKKLDEVILLEEVDANWWRGEKKGTGEKGLFPACYVSKKES